MSEAVAVSSALQFPEGPLVLPGGTLRVSQTFPPITDLLPIVIRPRIVAPA